MIYRDNMAAGDVEEIPAERNLFHRLMRQPPKEWVQNST